MLSFYLNIFFLYGVIDMIGIFLDMEVYMGMFFVEVLWEFVFFLLLFYFYEIIGGMDWFFYVFFF